MTNPDDKRRFSRVPFEGTARLHISERLLPVELLDISVRGAQVRLPKGEHVNPNDECRLTLTLDDSPIHLTLESQIRHTVDDQAGRWAGSEKREVVNVRLRRAILFCQPVL